MKFIRYSKFKGFDVFGLDLGSLDGCAVRADARLGLQRRLLVDAAAKSNRTIRSMRFDRRSCRRLLDQEVLDEQDVEQMLADNDGKFKGSLLEELINQLIERLVEEGYLNLKEIPQEQREQQNGNGGGEIGEPLPRNIKFEVTEKGSIFSVTKRCRNFSAASVNLRSAVTKLTISTQASRRRSARSNTSSATR